MAGSRKLSLLEVIDSLTDVIAQVLVSSTPRVGWYLLLLLIFFNCTFYWYITTVVRIQKLFRSPMNGFWLHDYFSKLKVKSFLRSPPSMDYRLLLSRIWRTNTNQALLTWYKADYWIKNPVIMETLFCPQLSSSYFLLIYILTNILVSWRFGQVFCVNVWRAFLNTLLGPLSCCLSFSALLFAFRTFG